MNVTEMARMGGKARREALTAKQRRQIAIDAGKASGAARRKKARQRAREARQRAS